MPLLVGEQEAAILDSQSRIANWLYNKLLEIADTLRAVSSEPGQGGGQDALHRTRGLIHGYTCWGTMVFTVS